MPSKSTTELNLHRDTDVRQEVLGDECPSVKPEIDSPKQVSASILIMLRRNLGTSRSSAIARNRVGLWPRPKPFHYKPSPHRPGSRRHRLAPSPRLSNQNPHFFLDRSGGVGGEVPSNGALPRQEDTSTLPLHNRRREKSPEPSNVHIGQGLQASVEVPGISPERSLC